MTHTIGIDLGTTYSCVGIWKNNKIEIIPNDQGKFTTPSCVAFSNDVRMIGNAAKNQEISNPENTIFNAKRLIGRKFSDEQVQDDKLDWPFKVIEGPSNKPIIEVEYCGEKKQFIPEEISAMVLSKMKEIAETYLSNTVTDAVITVPAYFNDSQRRATKDAATIAGLNCIRIINEPTAAAIAYGLDNKSKNDNINIIVFDLGGGTLDVSALNVDGGVFEVKATVGDTHLGGEDFDTRLVNYFIDEFKRISKKDISSDRRALRKLRTVCEKVKRTLSSTTHTDVEVDSLYHGIDFCTSITRARFEQLNMDLFERCIFFVEHVLREAKLDKSSIHEIVLVGGSTRIPKIREMLSDFFNGKKLNTKINPDQAVAHGAALQAAVLSGVKDKSIDNFLLLDVTPISLGIETEGGIMANIINRNTNIPVSRERRFTTCVDNQNSALVQIYEGERPLVKDNNLLGMFSLDNIRPELRCIQKIDVKFDIDDNGVLTVTAKNNTAGESKSIVITNEDGRLSDKDISRMICASEIFKERDNYHKKRIEAINSLKNALNLLRRSENCVKGLSKEKHDLLNRIIHDTTEWIYNNQLADPEEIKIKEIEIEKYIFEFIGTEEEGGYTGQVYIHEYDEDGNIISGKI